MANRAYMVPLRDDLAGMGLYVYDLKPNGSQKSSVLDGVGQSHYLHHSFNAQADDQVVNAAEGLVSGSPNRITIAATAAADVIAPGGNETLLTQATDFGLKAYLRERVHVNPGVNDDTLNQAELNLMFNSIAARADPQNLIPGGSNNLALADINGFLVAHAGAGTDLDGAGATSDSFGSVEDIIRILSGEVYRTRENTCVADQAGAFLSLTDRNTRVTGNQLAFPVYAQGGFLATAEVGFRAVPGLVPNGALRLSAKAGVLAAFAAPTGVAVLNPNFSRVGMTPTAARPFAQNPFDNVVIPANGIAPLCTVFDQAGIRID
jgi:hypothetical protein